MYLKKLSLLNYKNFSEVSFDFNEKINCFVGKNGMGKTNVLDAIYHLAYTKSYFNPLSLQNIKHGEDFFVIEGEFEKEQRTENVVCSLKKGLRKIVKRNGKLYDKFSEHIGFIPLVIISPSDNDLILEGSETRRKFIDHVISQLDNSYLLELIQYQKTLSQRNALLKYFAANTIFENETLSIYNEQLHLLGHTIFEKRKQFLEQFIPIFNKHHQNITENHETVHIIYESQLYNKDLFSLLNEHINKDRLLQYTSVGIHKDDLAFLLAQHPIKKFGSQGQQKSFLIALKLAQFDFLKTKRLINPILLFDDIFDKLDEFRVNKIISMVNSDAFGQLFISDTHPERTKAIVSATHQSYKLFELK